MRIHKKANEQKDGKISRRDFLSGTAATAAAFTIVPQAVLGQGGFVAPSNRVNIAVIGTGGQGISNIKSLLKYSDTHITDLCDVNKISDYSAFYYRGTAGLEPAKEYVETHYAKGKPSGIYKGCATHIDFREMLDKKNDIDAVLVATPDHVHAVATMAAIKKGKHVYCEKPLTYSVYEARMITEAARKAGVATQMGNHGHSGEGIRLMCEWIWDGAIGTVREVHVWSDVGYFNGEHTDRPKETPPIHPGLNWDLWLGPASYRPYHPAYAPFNWRSWWDFGTGALGDFGCHNMDSPFWALKLGHPTELEASSIRFNSEVIPSGNIIRYKFPARDDMPPVELTWYDGGLRPPRPECLEKGRKLGNNGTIFIGDKGVIKCGGWSRSPRLIPETKMKAYKRPPKTLPRSKGPHRDWLDACKGGAPASSNFDCAGPLTETVLLGNVAIRTGKELRWDGKNLKATNAPEADKYIRPPYRDGWIL